MKNLSLVYRGCFYTFTYVYVSFNNNLTISLKLYVSNRSCDRKKEENCYENGNFNFNTIQLSKKEEKSI
jgi:hypothetical protein